MEITEWNGILVAKWISKGCTHSIQIIGVYQVSKYIVQNVKTSITVFPLFLKLLSIFKVLILTAKLLVNIKTQKFYSCLILTEKFIVSIKIF